jgi:site-specific DNA-methyltransferase (adenine-specific)
MSSGLEATTLTERAYRRSGDGGTIILRNVDCLAGARALERQVGVIVTSPPYNLGVNYGAYDDTISRDRYLGWIGAWAAVMREALVDDGSMFLNVAGKPSDPLVPFEVLRVVSQHFILQNVIHWVKSISISKDEAGDYPGLTGDISVGHYKPLNTSRYLNDCHEFIFHFTKRGDVLLDRLAIGVPYQDKSNIGRWKGAKKDLRCRGNTWFIPYKTIQSRTKDRPHPASFPVNLPVMCLKLHGVERAGLVLDPFLGIGPSAVAAVRLGLDFVGFEIDPTYFQRACAAVEDEIRPPQPDPPA